jgi:hypothetical protein
MRPAQILAILEGEFRGTEQGFHTPVMLWGPPGVGKSQVVAQIASKHNVPVIDVRLSQMEPSDLRGIPFRSGNGLVEWAVPAMLPNLDRHGPRGVLFLDEITSAAPTVSAAAYQLILDRRLGEYRIPEGWTIFAAGNRQGDRGVTYSMPAPLANRFSHIEFETHLDDWVAWAYAHNIDERVIAFLRNLRIAHCRNSATVQSYCSARCRRALDPQPASSSRPSSTTWITCRTSTPSLPVTTRYRYRKKRICSMPSPLRWWVAPYEIATAPQK